MQDLIPKMNDMIITEVDDQQRQRLENFLQLKKKLGEPKSDDEVSKFQGKIFLHDYQNYSP